jgi:hypothetical protein
MIAASRSSLLMRALRRPRADLGAPTVLSTVLTS